MLVPPKPDHDPLKKVFCPAPALREISGTLREPEPQKGLVCQEGAANLPLHPPVEPPLLEEQAPENVLPCQPVSEENVPSLKRLRVVPPTATMSGSMRGTGWHWRRRSPRPHLDRR